jgi:hypothetical protein
LKKNFKAAETCGTTSRHSMGIIRAQEKMKRKMVEKKIEKHGSSPLSVV